MPKQALRSESLDESCILRLETFSCMVVGTHEKILAVSIQVFFEKKTKKYAQDLEFSVLRSEVSTEQTFHDV